MITTVKTVPQFLGIMTQYDPSQLPLGAALECKNLAQLIPGRLRRIPGVESIATVAVDGSVRIPLLAYMKGLGGSNVSVALYSGASTRTLVNLTSGSSMSGPALADAAGTPWTYAFYAQKHIVAGGGNAPSEVTNGTTYIALAGTSVPSGNLVQAFLDKLYISDISTEEGIVRYSGALITDFAANDLVNVKEIPGKVTALGVNSPSTDAVGIYTQLIICKRNAIWVYDEQLKDVVSQKIGTLSPHAMKNTKAGLIMLGKDGNRNSVFLLPIGTPGEPIDIGKNLDDILNGASPLSNEIKANATVDGRFYKLFFSRGADSTNASELWLDVDSLAEDRVPLWYGPHARGAVDMSCVTDTRLELSKPGASGANTWFKEKASPDSSFTNMSGTAMVAVLDLPINVEPFNDEKIFDVVELMIAKEANVYGNAIDYECFSEGVSQGADDMGIYQASLTGNVRVVIPIPATGITGMAARDARIKITHSLNERLDILSAAVQYLAQEDSRLRAQVLQTSTTYTGIKR